MKLLTILFLLATCHYSFSQDSLNKEIRTYMDMQMHPTMHVPYSFFGDGLEFFDKNSPPHLTYMHQLKNVNYANYWQKNKGARIIVAGSLTSEWIKSRKRGRKVILKQLDYVNDFALAHSEEFVVAKTPEEVRNYYHNTDKTIIIHSIEGAKRLINSLEDAQFWAEQGVAFITLMHLVDSEYGSAAVRPGFITTLLNLKGAVKGKKKRHLKEKGKQAIKWLAQAGIMTDLTHMEQQTRKDALAFMQQENIPPISTHDCFKSIKNTARSISGDEILAIYKLNGFMALPISGMEMQLDDATNYYQNKEDSLIKAGCHCPGSTDSYKFMYQELQQYIESNVGVILGDRSVLFSDLTEAEKVKYAIGFQSDFNGWLNHSRPRVGKKGCYPIDTTKTYEAIELEGLAHPGLLASQWRLLEKEGVDLIPIQRSSERFVQLWSYFRKHKTSWK
ncbi:MAG: Peptidase M19 renal dipeptidase [uncultured Aureispira sp.]|uniref:Peptidase M19 renal dipeptidase n=1 Tax=uncultured Aureispira sp. TaxID=1331704 RepID=A0A6S6RYM9_9BACT|nr:MAG: Peptidase M19 renal dipeptidase [uncultured Aureispira sp.]